MATQAEQLAELQSLNAQLGLAEDDGMPLTYEQKVQELRALDEQLASTPESFGEYVERRKVEDSRSLGDKTAAFTESFMTGAGALASEGSKAISELFAGDVGTSEVGGVFQVGINDFGRFAKTLGGAAMDNFYSDEGEMQREYQRYKDNFLYNQEVRPAMLETYDEEGRDFVSFGANFVDPTLLVPGAGLIAKGGSLGAKAVATGAKAGAFAARSPRLVQLSKAMARTSRGAEKVAKGLDKASEVASIPAKLAASGTRKAIQGSAFIGSKIAGGVGRTGEAVSKVAALPRNLATKLIPKLDPKTAGAVAATAQVGAATQGMVPGLGILTSAEILGFLANKTGRGVERTLSALSSKGGQKRFLQRLATTADSPRLRKLALMAHAGGATKLTDLAFNSLVNGASVGVLNGALAYISGEGAEGVGAAVGSGTLMGGSLPFGQPGMKGGKSQAARDQSSINFLNAKLADDQIKQFKNLSPEARLAFATVEEAGIRAPKLAFLDKKTYLDFLRQDDPNLRQAPNAHYDMGDNTIYVNQDGNAGRSSKEAMDILTHELGHHFITQGIKDDPLFARKILEQYEAKPGEESFDFAFTTDSAGSPIDSIQLNADAKKISDGYDSIQSGDQSISVGMNANKLAQEIGAEQFAMMMVDNPNIFNTIEPSLRQKLLDGSRKVLTMFGAVDPYTGNPLDISISPILKRNKQVRNLYKNYIKQREKSIVDKVDLAEKGVAIKVRKGESADQAVERMFGAQGISLKDSGAFRITNKKVKEKLSQILNRLDEQPEGPMSSERNPRSDKPQSIVGKELSPELKNVFTRNDPRGTINVLINDITESIRDRIQLNFLYRSGKPSKYSDNELKGRVVSPVRFKVTGLSKGSRSAASLKMDAIDEAYLRNNVEVLVKEGFAKDPNKLIEQAREVARQALDNEGKINPEGNFENELITAVFGQKESAPQIKDARLRELLAAKDSKLQHAYRSYDIDALAGIAPTGKSGIAFDWFNIENNYSPFDDKLFMPTETFEGSPGSYFRPKSSRDTSAQVRTFKSPVQLKDGSRLSGVADNPEQSPFYGFDKNGQEFSQGREYINPQDITKSRDSDRTANQIRNELESGQKLFIPAFHGTPHTLAPEAGSPLGKFRTSAIGTGEGAQAYGHGLYFAGKREVAEHYRTIPDNDLLRISGEMQKNSRIMDEEPKVFGSYDKFKTKRGQDARKQYDELIRERERLMREGGSLYKVELAPKDSEYLLWDKPVSDSFVDSVIEKSVKEGLVQDKDTALDAIAGNDADRQGSIFYSLLSDQLGGNKQASQFLKEAGIPGIKYLDGASRSKGEGDFNYVIFDEADVTVTEKLFMPASEAGATKGKVAEGTFDAGERNILFMPAGGDKLTATHNLSAEALAKADELGGLPVPSVGITKGRALEGFGEVTLLGTRPLVDPELGVPAFGSDVYSKRFPREKYKSVKMKKADEFVAKYRPFANETGGHELSLIFDALVNHPDLGDAKHRFMTSEFAKMAFLKDKGKPVRVPKRKERVDGIVDQQLVDEVNALGGSVRSSSTPEYKLYSEYLRKAFDRREKVINKFTSDKERNQRLSNKELENLFDENGLARIGVGDRLLYDIDRFNNLVVDKSKLRDRIEKKFTKKMKADYEKWATQEIASLFDDPYIVVDGRKVPLSLDTATDAMKGRIRAVEKNMTFGPGEARSMGSSKISSIQMMRNMSDSIVPKEQFETYKETIQEPIHEAFRNSAMDAYKYSDGWASLDLSYRALGQYLQSFKGSNKQRMRSALRQNDFIPNDALIEKAIKAAEVLRDAPTEYFEAKPQRAVKLEEFAGAIIPKKASPKVKELADKYGWEVKTYDPNKPETRQTAVKQLANRLQKQGKEVLFMPSDPKAPKAQPANRVQQQAPAMPGNRFMAPAASAGAKLSERFNR